MYGWLVIVPPLLILFTAFWTRNIIVSVLLGICAAALIATHAAPITAGTMVYTYLYNQLVDPDSLLLFAFLFMLGAIISLIDYTGGAQALGHAVSRRIKNAKAAQSASLLLSPLLFVDDALNSLTVGCVVQPLTDRFSIPRVKLAYLLNAMSSPLAVVIPMSSWVACIIKQIQLSGVSRTGELVTTDPFYAYLSSIPFVFYTFVAIASAWFVIHASISYGPMHRHEECARKTGNLFLGKSPRFQAAKCPHAGKGSVTDLLAPIVTLVLCTMTFVLYSGDYWLLGGTNTLAQAFRNAQMIRVLCVSTGAALITSYLLALTRGTIPVGKIASLIGSGFKLMLASVSIIFLASTFAAILDHELHTGAYLAELVMPAISITFMPLVTFLVSILVALAIGSSWGTIAIVMPLIVPLIVTMSGIATPTTLDAIPLLTACIGAVLSGCIVGVQMSPVSDAVTTASTGSGCYQIDHVTTQIWYVLPAAAGAAVAFMCVGILPLPPLERAGVSIAAGIACSWMLLYVLNRLLSTKNKPVTI